MARDQHLRPFERTVNGMRKHSGQEVFRITGARAGLTDDVRQRQRRYVISMSIRTVSVILTVLLWNVERPLAWATLVVGALLPYIAVVVANAGRENPPKPPDPYLPLSDRPELDRGRRGEAESPPERVTEPPDDHPGPG